jgi:hypothetical protein
VEFIDRLRRPHQGFLTLALLAQLAALPLGGGVLFWVAQHSGPSTATVVVHVTETDVVVNLDSQTFRVDEYTGIPIVCELPAGKHRLTMTHGEDVVHDEIFALEGGEDRILTAWHSLTVPK